MKVLIHIGYHKTATTWLQKRVFENSSGFYPLSDGKDFPPLRCKHMGLPFYETTPFDFDGPALRFHIEQNCPRQENKMAVISDERLSGAPLFGIYDSLYIAQRLHEVLPEARILIGIREQTDMILSMYYQYLKRGMGLSFKAFIAAEAAGRHAAFTPDYCKYDRLIALYHKLFGPDRVMVYALEGFRRNPVEFLKSLYAFAEQDGPENYRPAENGPVNTSDCYWIAEHTRLLGPLLARDIANAYSPLALPVNPYAGQKALRAIRTGLNYLVPRALDRNWLEQGRKTLLFRTGPDYFALSNRRTEALTGLDLKSLGYQ